MSIFKKLSARVDEQTKESVMTEEQTKALQADLAGLKDENAKLKAELDSAKKIEAIKGLCAKIGAEVTDDLLALASVGEAAVQLIASFKKEEPKAKVEEPKAGKEEPIAPSATFRQVPAVTGDAPEFAFTTKVEAIRHYKAQGMTAKAAGLHVAKNHNDLPN